MEEKRGEAYRVGRINAGLVFVVLLFGDNE